MLRECSRLSFFSFLFVLRFLLIVSIEDRGVGMIIFRRFENYNKPMIQYLIFESAYLTQEAQWYNYYIQVKQGRDETESAFTELEKRTGIQQKNLKVVPGFLKKITHKSTRKTHVRLKHTDYFLAELIEPDMDLTLRTSYKNYKWVSLAESGGLFDLPQQFEIVKAADEFLNNMKTSTEKVAEA